MSEITLRRRVLYALYSCGLYKLTVLRRYHLPYILNILRLRGEGAEIGVAEGVFSETLLKYWRGKKLYSIDPWKAYPDDEYRDVSNVEQGAQDARCERAGSRLNVFGERSEVLRMTSEEAVKRFPDRQLDFVYIDAQHHYEAVKHDLEIWFPKVKNGGVFAGHDYLNGSLPQGEYGVKRAVTEFANEQAIRVVPSRERDFPSWYMFL